MTGPQILRALDACARVRATYPDVPIVWGGIHPTLLPEQTLEHPLVDIIVSGEGEATFDGTGEGHGGRHADRQCQGHLVHSRRARRRFTGHSAVRGPGCAAAARVPPPRDGPVQAAPVRPATTSASPRAEGARSAAPSAGNRPMNHRRWRAMQPETVRRPSEAPRPGARNPRRAVRGRQLLRRPETRAPHPGVDRPRAARPQPRQAPDPGRHRLRDG